VISADAESNWIRLRYIYVYIYIYIIVVILVPALHCPSGWNSKAIIIQTTPSGDLRPGENLVTQEIKNFFLAVCI
jgi:hypothetical protein